jgi:hypothetical protein
MIQRIHAPDRKLMNHVYVVQHVHEFEDGSEDVKFIGVYRTEATAQAAIERLRVQPGFRRSLEGFHADRYELDKDHWTEGYVTMMPDGSEID